MSLPRAHAKELARLFNSATSPIYMLDDELTIVFLNQAVLEWLGVEQSLVGRRCAYHSSAAVDDLDALAAGLCPPPQVLAGKPTVATVSRKAEDGRLIERRADFLPIGSEASGLVGVLAVLDAADQPVPSDDDQQTPDARSSSEMLHDEVRRFRQQAAARYRADRLIGQGSAMRLARRQVELSAASRGSVLLVGPTGSGRRHLAAAIHYGAAEKGDSPHLPERPGGCFAQMGTVPFFRGEGLGMLAPLDCALLGADLLGAVAEAVTRGSRLDDPSGPGTLLLHRIDELSADVQAELADFMARRPLAWRLIATSAEPLVELARRGKFREDLACLLSTVVIELPPLDRRREDLPLLAQLFLEELNATGQRQIGGFTPAALDLLDSYAWPGNLDELAQVVAESHRQAAGREIDVNDLPERLRRIGQAAAHPRRTEETIVLSEYLGRVERELIRRALARAKGNKARAARLLGMTRPRLYRRMVQLGLEQADGG
jgi:DNA-binding NtrC family response regulator